VLGRRHDPRPTPSRCAGRSATCGRPEDVRLDAVEQIVQWTSSFYPTWDHAYAQQLLRQFDLPAKGKVKTLSKGQNTRLALLLALAHRPESSSSMIRRWAWTHRPQGVPAQRDHVAPGGGDDRVLLQHLLYEIEPVADRIAILDQGRIIKAAPTDELRDTVRRFVFRPKVAKELGRVPGVLDAVQQDGRWNVTVELMDTDTRAAWSASADGDIEEIGLNLDEIFEAYVIGNRGREVAPC